MGDLTSYFHTKSMTKMVILQLLNTKNSLTFLENYIKLLSLATKNVSIFAHDEHFYTP